MKVKPVPAHVLTPIVSLLAPYCPELNERCLIAALRALERDAEPRMTPMLTKREAARLCKVSSYTIIRMVKSGRLPGVKVSGQWRIPAAALQALIDGGQDA